MDGTEGFAMTNFLPGAGAERAYRDALGKFGTGVTVVTAMGPEGPCGITANSFSSVSLEPALVLWSMAKSSERFEIFNNARFCAIHVLGSGQTDLARRFAKNGTAFAGLDWSQGETGAPLLEGCLSRFECELFANHDAGDHRILVNRVLRVSVADGAPLLFAGGRFGEFAASG